MAITIPQGFDVQSPEPVEIKSIQPTADARNSISLATRYEGMKVYVVDIQKNFQLVGGLTNDFWVQTGDGIDVGSFYTKHDLQTSGDAEVHYDNLTNVPAFILQDDAVIPNAAIVGATKTKITYDAKGLVTSGADATTADIADSTDKRYVSDAEKTAIGHSNRTALDAVENTNTGDETQTSIKTKLGAATASVDGYATSTQITKLDGIEEGAEKNVQADWSAISGDSFIQNKPTIPSQYTDELAQDAVGNILTNTGNVQFTYDDVTPKIIANVDLSGKLNTGLAVLLDQTSPQTILNGIPELSSTRNITTDYQLVDKKYVDNHVPTFPPNSPIVGVNNLGAIVNKPLTTDYVWVGVTNIPTEKPISNIISAKGTLISGQLTVIDTAITTNSFAVTMMSTVGASTSVPIKFTASNGSMLFSTGQSADTCDFGYIIFI